MKTEWNLDLLYTGIGDPNYEENIKAFEERLKAFHVLVDSAPVEPTAEYIGTMLKTQEQITVLMMKLYQYLELRQSVNSEDGEVMAQMSRVMRIYSSSAADETAAAKIYGKIEDPDGYAQISETVRDYLFLIKQAKKECAHLLSDDAEAMISVMNMTGGSAWGQLQAYLTSTVKVDYEDGQVTLSEIRNMAYSDDADIRKKAYEAELACYDKIADSIAFSLNNIKNQVTTLSKMKGYSSPLDMTLEKSRMSRETLEAMMEAVKEYLPAFRKYLRKKGKILGYNNGLPWFELFAPVGKSEQKYTVEDAKEYLVNCFNTLSADIADMMSEAFDNEWIDFYPKQGKVGGAFCAGITGYKQSRILTNYDGTFGAVDTLAHELGHAFHNRQLENERPMNTDYPMPIAETASTFNEVHLGNYALSRAAKDERMALLENDLREKTQCIVDIYSRFLFEKAVFEQSQNKFLMASDLKKIMLDCQKEAYGDGLDPQYMHPYMWVCKSHYYSSGLSFYNFPYTFGNLLAQGLYNIYTQQSEGFMDRYKEMLRLTAVHSMEENGAVMGIDLTKKDFWQQSLASIAKEIEEFCEL